MLHKENLEIFLLSLRYKDGRLIDVEGNKPLLLDNESFVWIIYSGMVDVFVVPIDEKGGTGIRSHLFRCGSGQALFGMSTEQVGVGLLVTGLPGTRLLRLRRERFLELSQDIEYDQLVLGMMTEWVTSLSSSIADKISPRDYLRLEPGIPLTIENSAVLTPIESLVWVRFLSGGVHVMGRAELSWSPADSFLPVSKQWWLQSMPNTQLEVLDTSAFVAQDTDWRAVQFFHQLILKAFVFNRLQASVGDLQRLKSKQDSDKAVMEKALFRLASPLGRHKTIALAETIGDSSNHLLAACRLVGHFMGIPIEVPPGLERYKTWGQTFEGIVRASHIRSREVQLNGRWWQEDNGPLLGFWDKEQRPVALLPLSPRKYELVDPLEKTRIEVTAESASKLLPYGFMFYRPLPIKPLNGRDLLEFGLKGNGREIIFILFLATLIGLLGLIPSIVIGWLFDTVIPNAAIDTLLQVGLWLFALALISGLLQFTRGITLVRVQTKMDSGLQAAIWDRLLNLPVSFFRDFSAGDLGSRAMGITTIRRILSGYVITSIFSGLFSTFNLGLLFFYSPRLALVALFLILISVGITIIGNIFYIRYQRILSKIEGDVSGIVLQLLTGVVKFRVAGAEKQAFSLWANKFTEKKRAYYSSRRITNNLRAYNVVYGLFSSLVIFAMVAYTKDDQISTGDFASFYSAFLQFLGSWFVLSTTLVYMLTIIPVFERMRPILEAVPEVDETKLDPGELTGKIEISRVSFRYTDKGPLILREVSLQIKAGEFVAFVGPSGSGKTSLMRLMLGFEKPESGGIYYDDQDLADVDLQNVRKQIGVVLQNAVLMGGDIFSNIIGASPDLTLDDAWEAAQMAGLEDDIKSMPMGMHTVISGRGTNLSGGQKQRLLIARALATKPRILFFDEATSALDNERQAIVSQSLENLKTTRIVIAHRLSTIIRADRIYVFEDGKIVQSGTYNELLLQPGLFAELARRQMV